MQAPQKKKFSGKYDSQLKVAIAMDYFTINLGYGSLAKKYGVPDGTVPSTIKKRLCLSLTRHRCCLRKIVGYHMSQQLKAQGCLIALEKAIASLSQPKEQRTLIHHSDRGTRYCCEPYVSLLQQNNISISMTQSDSPYDNAVAERVNSLLKTELNLGSEVQGCRAGCSPGNRCL